MPSCEFNNISIHYCVYQPIENDEGEVLDLSKSLLFLHGFLEDLSIWDQIIPTFQKLGYTCLAIDLPCHGLTRFEDEVCSMQFMAEAVNSVLNELKFSPEKIVGHSMGGYVALELTELRDFEPILLHSNFWEDPPEKKNDRNRVIEIVKKNKALFINEAIPGLFASNNKSSNQDVIERLISNANKIPENEICAATAGLRDRRAFYSLKNNQRLSILHGDLDPIIPNDKMIVELQKFNSDHLFSNLQEVGHMGIWEDRKTVISSIKSILIS